MADQGTDANFISASVLEEIKKHLPSLQVKKLSPSLICGNVSEDPCNTCAQSVFLDVFRQIRQGTSIVRRITNWKTSGESRKTPIIGRKVPESFGCDNRDMLLNAHNKMGYAIDISEKLNQDENEEEHEGVVASLYGESVIHSGVHAEDNGLRNEDVYVDLGNGSI